MSDQVKRLCQEFDDKLFRWQSPHELYALVERANNDLGPLFVSSRHAKQLREAWIIGRTFRRLDLKSVRISQSPEVDGFVETSTGHRPVEVTELLQPGRRRGLEAQSGLIHFDQAEVDAARIHNLAWMTQRINAKLAKDDNYPQDTILLMYHNTSLFDIDSTQVAWECREAARLKGVNICGVLILLGEVVYGAEILAN